MEEKLNLIKSRISLHEDFPKDGVDFVDIMGIFRHPPTLKAMRSLFVNHIQSTYFDKGIEVHVICGLEARGFLIGPIVAEKLDCSFVPIRKKGKLPGECFTKEYVLEYGKDCIEVQKHGLPPNSNVIIIDDLLATGGTMAAAITLVHEAHAKVLEAMTLIELEKLDGRQKLGQTPFTSFLRF